MLFEQVSKDYVQAMKAKDTLKSSTLSFLRAQLKNVMIDKRQDTLDDADVISILKKQVKQRQDSIAQYESGGRSDLAEKETAELAVLKSYLPQELGEAEITAIVTSAIQETGARSVKDMGQVMKAVSAKIAGRADNRLVSEIVKKALSS